MNLMLLRGGSWLNGPGLCRSAFRFNQYRDSRYDYCFGFRVF